MMTMTDLTDLITAYLAAVPGEDGRSCRAHYYSLIHDEVYYLEVENGKETDEEFSEIVRETLEAPARGTPEDIALTMRERIVEWQGWYYDEDVKAAVETSSEWKEYFKDLQPPPFRSPYGIEEFLDDWADSMEHGGGLIDAADVIEDLRLKLEPVPDEDLRQKCVNCGELTDWTIGDDTPLCEGCWNDKHGKA